MIRVLEAFGEPISIGGQESFVMNFAKHTDYRKYNIDYLTPYYCDNLEIADFVKSKNGKIFSFRLEFRPGHSRLDICKKLDLFFKNNKYDVVHVHTGSISVLGIFAYYAKKNGIKKVIVHSHASIEHKSLKNTILRYIIGVVLDEYADIYCACSQAAGISKFTNQVVKNKLIVIKNGINLDKFKYSETIRREMRDILKISPEDFVIGHVGRFSREKNHEFLINLFSELRISKINTKLLLVGEGKLRKRIHDLVVAKGLQDQVIFTGAVDNVQDYMQAMDFFILPSKYEGLGIAAIEAQAMGLPCLLSTGCPNETKLTDLVEFVSLNSDINIWIQKINFSRSNKRTNYNSEVMEAGYSIDTLKNQIECLYSK